MPKKEKIHHIGIVYNNFQKAVEFYRNIGINQVGEFTISKDIASKLSLGKSEYKVKVLKKDNILIEVFHIKKPRTAALKSKVKTGLHHFAIQVADKKKFIRRVRAKQIKVISLKRKTKTVYFLKDPEGNLIEVK